LRLMRLDHLRRCGAKQEEILVAAPVSARFRTLAPNRRYAMRDRPPFTGAILMCRAEASLPGPGEDLARKVDRWIPSFWRKAALKFGRTPTRTGRPWRILCERISDAVDQAEIISCQWRSSRGAVLVQPGKMKGGARGQILTRCAGGAGKRSSESAWGGRCCACIRGIRFTSGTSNRGRIRPPPPPMVLMEWCSAKALLPVAHECQRLQGSWASSAKRSRRCNCAQITAAQVAPIASSSRPERGVGHGVSSAWALTPLVTLVKALVGPEPPAKLGETGWAASPKVGCAAPPPR